MRTRSKLVLTVVPAGIALGALLGAAADPQMKNLPEPSSPADSAHLAPGQVFEGVAVYELSHYRDRHPPTLSDEAIADWAPDYPDWTYGELGDEPSEPLPDGWAAPPEPEPQPPAAPEPLPPDPPGDGSLAALY